MRCQKEHLYPMCSLIQRPDEAGIQKGDIVTYIDGERITGMDELQGLLEYYSAGTEIEIVLMRPTKGEYKEITINVKLGAKEQ